MASSSAMPCSAAYLRTSSVIFISNSAIHFTAVADAVDAHHADGIGNFINHPVVAHANAPVVFAANQFAATGRARIVREFLNCRNNAAVNLGGKTAKVAFGRAFKEHAIHGQRRRRPAR